MKRSILEDLTWENAPDVGSTPGLLLLCVYRESDLASRVWLRTVEAFAAGNPHAPRMAKADLDSGAFNVRMAFNGNSKDQPGTPYLLAFADGMALPLRLDGFKEGGPGKGGFATVEAIGDFARDAGRMMADVRRGRNITVRRPFGPN